MRRLLLATVFLWVSGILGASASTIIFQDDFNRRSGTLLNGWVEIEANAEDALLLCGAGWVRLSESGTAITHGFDLTGLFEPVFNSTWWVSPVKPTISSKCCGRLTAARSPWRRPSR